MHYASVVNLTIVKSPYFAVLLVQYRSLTYRSLKFVIICLTYRLLELYIHSP